VAEVVWRPGCRVATFDKAVLKTLLDLAIRRALLADL
jgi:hypothetical protein